MKVYPVNNQKNNVAMQGYIEIKGANKARTLRNAIINSSYFNEISEVNDVVTRIVYKIADYKGKKDEVLFKIKYSLLKENSLVDRIADLLNLKPRYEYNKQYNSADELINMLEK